MTSQGFRELSHGGSELVLAAHYNTYGTRLVTGSADHRIRVFNLGVDGTWEIADVWGAHKGEVLDVSMRSGFGHHYAEPFLPSGEMEWWINGASAW